MTDVPVRVHAIDRATGRLRWSADVDDGVRRRRLHSGSSALRVGSEHGLSALDTSTGEVAWRVPLEGATRPESDGRHRRARHRCDDDRWHRRLIAFAGAPPTHAWGRRHRRHADRKHASAASAIAYATISPSGLRAVLSMRWHPAATLLGGALGPDGTLYVPDVANDRSSCWTPPDGSAGGVRPAVRRTNSTSRR